MDWTGWRCLPARATATPRSARTAPSLPGPTSATSPRPTRRSTGSTTLAARPTPARTTAETAAEPRSRGFELGLDERGLAALGERDLDRVEVARDDHVLERRAGLFADLARKVAGGDVHKREQLDLGVGGQLGGLASGGVSGLAGALAVVLAEGRLVDEHVGVIGVDLGGLGRLGVAGVDDPAARTVLANDLVGVYAVDGLAPLEAPEVGARLDAQGLRGLDVEPARPVVLDER